MAKKKLSNNDVEIAKRIKAIRVTNKLTQEKMAELFDVTTSMVKKYESGENNLTIRQLNLLHDKYNVSADYLLFGEVKDKESFEYQFESFSPKDKSLMLLKLLFDLCGEDKDTFMKCVERSIKGIEESK